MSENNLNLASVISREFFIGIRFGIVGILATIVHIAFIWIILKFTSISVLPANSIAFFIAFLVSFTGHYKWTFSSPGNPSRAIFRFFSISAFGFIINTFLLLNLVNKGFFTETMSAIIAIIAIPIISFIGGRIWAFSTKTNKKK